MAGSQTLDIFELSIDLKYIQLMQKTITKSKYSERANTAVYRNVTKDGEKTPNTSTTVINLPLMAKLCNQQQVQCFL